MPVGDLETVNTPEEMQRKLRAQGIAGVDKVTLLEGVHGGEADAAVIFSGQHESVRGVGFNSKVITTEAAHQIISRLTILKRKGRRQIGPRFITVYTLEES